MAANLKWNNVRFDDELYPDDCAVFILAGKNHSFIIQTIKHVSSNTHERVVETIVNYKTMRYSIHNPSKPELTVLYSLNRSFIDDEYACQNYCGAKLNASTDELFLWTLSGRILIIDYVNKTFQVIKSGLSALFLFFINDHLHIISNQQQHCFGIIKDGCFKIEKKSHVAHDDLDGHEAIHIPSKQCILSIGRQVKMFFLKACKWKKMENTPLNDITDTLPYIRFHAILSSNERYLIFFVYVESRIYVLDMMIDNEWKLKMCMLHGPKKSMPLYCKDLAGRTGGVDSDDEKLVNGFIRDCFKEKEFENLQLLPSYLVKMIEQKYSAETFHFIGLNDRCEILLADILNSAV